MFDTIEYDGLLSKENVVDVFHCSGDLLIIATGSETRRKNFSVILLNSLSETVRETTNSHSHGNGKLIIDGLPCHCFKYLNQSEDVISR
jgi:hypothetical protein